MSKEFFKNLPDKSTPINASRLNGLFNGNEALGNIVVGDVKCKNLFNKYDVIDGQYINDGQISYDENMCCNSSFICVSSNETYTLSCNISSTIFIEEYNENKTYISQVAEWEKKEVSFTTSSTTKFLKISISKSSKDIVQLEQGTIATEYVPYKGIGYTSSCNENGNWMKFDDGTMICRGVTTLQNVVFAKISDGCYYSEARQTIWLPETFINDDDISGSVTCLNIDYLTEASFTYATNVAFDKSNIVFTILKTTGESKNIKVTWTALGKWK